MTHKRLSDINRRRLIVQILKDAPWLTQQDIAEWVGCSNRYVSRVLCQDILRRFIRAAPQSAK